MDAFGTGYSSLSYLRDLPVDELKIDRSFILNMADDARAAALVACSLALARGLSVRMVTEGVQNHITYIELSSLGYDRAQGYYCPGLFPLPSLNHGLSIRPATDKLGDVSRWVRSRALDEVPLGFLAAMLCFERASGLTPIFREETGSAAMRSKVERFHHSMDERDK